MSLSHFLAGLVESGRVTISLDLNEPVSEEAYAALQGMDQRTRAHLAGIAPEFVPQVSLWAAQLLYRGCQLLVCRDLDKTVIDQVFLEPCPLPHSPETDYSADLTLQFLPDLITMTRQIASGDPLLEALLRIARDWPLSSVGVTGLENMEIESFIDNAALRHLYADRILEREDLSRLGNPKVDQALKDALGAFPELCQPVAKRLGISNMPVEQAVAV